MMFEFMCSAGVPSAFRARARARARNRNRNRLFPQAILAAVLFLILGAFATRAQAAEPARLAEFSNSTTSVPAVPAASAAVAAPKPVPAAPKPASVLSSATLAKSAAARSSATLAGKPAESPLGVRDDRNLNMVAVEALVVEVNEERTRDLGINYSFNQAQAGVGNTVVEGSGVVRGVDTRLGRALTPVAVPALISQPGGQNAIGLVNRLPGLGINLVGMNVDGGAVSARLRALLSTGDATIRTRPVAVALNRTSVRIETVNEVPTLLVSGGRQLNVDFKKVGVMMEVTPTIESLRPVGVATLDISRLEVSAVSNFVTTRNIDRPVFTRSATQTRVTLGAGETFVVGGLKTRRTVHVEDRVPILGDIPGLGLLFRSQQDVERNRDVLFFITPYILPPGQNFLLPFDFKHQRALGIEAARSGK